MNIQHAQQHIQQWLLARSLGVYTRLEHMFLRHVDSYRAEYKWVGVIAVWYCAAAALGWCVGAALAVI